MKELLRDLCLLNAPSGREDAVRTYLIKKIGKSAEWRVDALGNLIVEKKGRRRAACRVMVDAHMDEVGMIVTAVTERGLLKFDCVGGINIPALMGKRVQFGSTVGVIGCKPVHLLEKDERKKLPAQKDLFIDIGATEKASALRMVQPGDIGTFAQNFTPLNDNLFLSKAIDDRAGCAVLLSLLCEESEVDFTAVFSVQEEVGLRGARTACYEVDPTFALCLEATTAADLPGATEENRVCELGKGPAVSFMDRSTLYDRELFHMALNSGVECQIKTAVTGGNNAGAVHLSRTGVRTLTLSLPCRYIHSPCSVASLSDLKKMKELARRMIDVMADGTTV